MRVVATGGARFIGRQVVSRLGGPWAFRELAFQPRPLEEGIADTWGRRDR
jgi:hypothetical protein